MYFRAQTLLRGVVAPCGVYSKVPQLHETQTLRLAFGMLITGTLCSHIDCAELELWLSVYHRQNCYCPVIFLQGEIWAETTFMGFKWHFYACMQNTIYDVTDWVVCQVCVI